MSKKLILNSFTGTTLYVLRVIVSFVLSPIYIGVLGNRDYGLWELVMSVVGYMGLLDLGVLPALTRFVSIAEGGGDKKDFQRTISTAFAFFTVISVVVMILFFILSLFPEILIGEDVKNISNIIIVLILVGLNSAILFPLQVFTATLMGLQRHYIVDGVKCIFLLASSIVTYFLLVTFPDNGLVIMATITLFFSVLQLTAFSIIFLFDRNIPKITFSSISYLKAKEMLVFGGKSVMMMTASRLQNQSIPIIIGRVLGVGHIVYFVMPNRLIDYARGISQVLGLPLTPYFGSTIGRGKQKELVLSWLNTSLALQVIALFMPMVVIFYGEIFIKLWIGSEYAEIGRPVLYFLTAGLIADALCSNAFRILTALGMHGKCAMLWLVLSCVSIPIGVLGANFWGVAGVAAVISAVTILGNLITLSLACVVLNISLITYFRKTTLRLLPLFSTLLLLFVLLGYTSSVQSYFGIVLHLSIVGVVYVCMIWFRILEQPNREKILFHVRKFL